MSVTVNGSSGLTFNDGSVQNTAPSGFGFKNRLINSAMMIDQRNAGASVTANGAYPVDRFYVEYSMDGTYSALRDTTAPAGFINSLKFTTTSADASLGASQYVICVQSVEGLNCADLGWGTASASTVTLSFWVRSSLTGTFGGSLRNSAGNRSYPFSYTISSANTWEQKSITIAGDTSGTWLTTNGIGINLSFGLGVGSTFSGTANAWAGANYLAPTGATSVVGTNGATFYITGVQLEKGSTATSFDYRPYGTELALCQRYYGAGSIYGWPRSADNVSMASVVYKVSMRTATPTIALGDGSVQSGGPDSRTTEGFGAYKTGTASGTLWTTTWTANGEL